MANHQSAIKRIRQSEAKRVENKYFAKTMRNAVSKLRATSDKTEASEQLPKVSSMIDRLARRNTIHKNKAANLKSGLTNYVNSL